MSNPIESAPCSADLLRSESERVKAMNHPLLEHIHYGLSLAAAWLDSLQAAEQQTRYINADLLQKALDGAACAKCGATGTFSRNSGEWECCKEEA